MIGTDVLVLENPGPALDGAVAEALFQSVESPVRPIEVLDELVDAHWVLVLQEVDHVAVTHGMFLSVEQRTRGSPSTVLYEDPAVGNASVLLSPEEVQMYRFAQRVLYLNPTELRLCA